MNMERVRSAAARGLSLPAEAVSDLPLVTMVGGSEIRVENYKSIAEFSDGRLRLSSKGFGVRVDGAGLYISRITRDSVTIGGKIDKIEIIR